MNNLTHILTLAIGLAIGLFYSNYNKNSAPKNVNQSQNIQQSQALMQTQDKVEANTGAGIQQSPPNIQDTTDDNVNNTAVPIVANTLPEKNMPEHLKKYNFSNIIHYTPEDISFQSYFTKLSSDKVEAKLKSIDGALRSGLIQNAVISQTIYIEISKLVLTPNEFNGNPKANLYYVNELVKKWHEIDPEYASPDLIQHFKFNLGEDTLTKNQVFNELETIIGK